MPITSIDSFPAVTVDFCLHWGQVNDSPTGGGGTTPLLPGGSVPVQSLAHHDLLVTALNSHQNLLNYYQLGLADRDSQRVNLRERISNFRQTCQSQFPGARYLPALPDTHQPMCQFFAGGLSNFAQMVAMGLGRFVR